MPYSDLGSAEAQQLQAELNRTEIALKKAQREHKLALSRAIDMNFSPDSSRGLRLAARHYSATVNDHNKAVQKWADYLLSR